MTPVKNIKAGRLRVLIIEDFENDAEMLLIELRRSRWEIAHKRVDSPGEMSAALDAQPWDLIIADYSMPNFSGLAALAMAFEPVAENFMEKNGRGTSGK